MPLLGWNKALESLVGHFYQGLSWGHLPNLFFLGIVLKEKARSLSMLLVLQKGVSLVLGHLFHHPPGLVLMQWCSWLMCGFPSLSIPSVCWWRQVYFHAASGSLELSSKGSGWHLFFKAGMIRQIQEEPNPSFFYIFSVGIPSCYFLLSLTERLTHQSLSDSPLLSRGSWCGLTSSVVSFQFFALVSMCRVQKNASGAAPHPGKLLG